MNTKIAYLNFEGHSIDNGVLIKTKASLPKLTDLMAGIIFNQKLDSKPIDIAKQLPQCQIVHNQSLLESANYVFNNDAASDNVPFSYETRHYNTGIRISHAFYDHQQIYTINLSRIKQTHHGTHYMLFAKKAEKELDNQPKFKLE